MPDSRELQRTLGEWYAASARDLPWRRHPFLGDPYAVLVSEVMLQQTQIERTVPKYLTWMERFPTLEDLAGAPISEVIILWSGMGYNNRAVRLHRLAGFVTTNLKGQIPKDVDDLVRLPGIGPYTAAAVACFAFGASVPVLDTNVYRVLSRVHFGVEAPARPALEPIARDLVPAADADPGPSTWHQALMDLGATICTAAAPRCMLCPLRPLCAAAPQLQSSASRKLAESSVPYVPKQPAFVGSTRYYRGRIIELLRGAQAPGVRTSDIFASFDDGTGADRAKLDAIVATLVKDGLAVREGEMLRLP